MSNTLDYKRILVYRIGHLGDTLVSLPAFWAIRNAFPLSRLTLLTNADVQNPNYITARGVLPEKGLFDEWLFYNSGFAGNKAFFSLLKLFWEIRQQDFDCLFYLMTRNRTVKQIRRDLMFFRLAGVKKIFGVEYLLKNLVGEIVEKPLLPIDSEIDFFLKTLASDDFEFDFKSKPEMCLTEDEREFAGKWLQINAGKALNENRLMAVAPASKWDSKIWSEERFAEVVSKLIERKGIFPIIFGGREDREKGNRLLKFWKTGANAAGELNIRQAAAALEKCRLYLGNDTGAMHLAASVGTPCAAVFAAIDWAGRWNPFGNNHIIFREHIECENCLLSVCPFENQCLTRIKVEDVLAACEEILER